MLKDVIGKLDYSHFDEIALVIFSICFLAICWGALRLRNDSASRYGHIPIDDLVPESKAIDVNSNNYQPGIHEGASK
jgi:cbb3-type cytochrome oxidase subunit 3